MWVTSKKDFRENYVAALLIWVSRKARKKQFNVYAICGHTVSIFKLDYNEQWQELVRAKDEERKREREKEREQKEWMILKSCFCAFLFHFVKADCVTSLIHS